MFEKKNETAPKSQSAAFREATPSLGSNDNEKQFNATLRKIVESMNDQNLTIDAKQKFKRD